MTFLDRRMDRFRSKYLDSRMVLLMDLTFSVLCSLLVIAVARLAYYSLPIGGMFTLVWLFCSAIASGFMFWGMRTYTLIIRHTTFKDLFRFGAAALGKVLLMFAGMAVANLLQKWLWVALLCDFLFTVVVLLGIRVLMILAYDFYKSRVRDIQRCTRVLVYGTSDKSTSVIQRLAISKHYDILGILSPDKSIKGSKFADKSVYTFSSKEDFDKIVSRLSLSGVLFSRDADAKIEADRVVTWCSEMNLKVLMVPTVAEMTEDQLERGAIRPIRIEDLLCRDEIQISLDEIRHRFQGKTVMVTGAAGSIGSELCRQLAKFGIEKLILFDNAETPMHNLRLEIEEKYKYLQFIPVIGDVRSLPRLDYAFHKFRPNVVFHAAAYKHVPLMEENPCEAVLVNVVGSRQVADKCLEYGVEKMVMISTDKAVNPTNIMGCSKRLAEIYVQSVGLAVERGEVKGSTQFVTTRFGNVLGSNGSVIPRFREQIEKGGPVTVTHPDINRFFMTIPEACRLVMEAATLPTENRICVFDMGEPVKIDTLARRMIELSGFEPDKDIKIEYTGLRPGEKLYEEVLSNVENTEPTSHERIRIARVREYDYKEATAVVDKLEELSRAVEIPEMVKLMKATVPEFISNNSQYSVYDKK